MKQIITIILFSCSWLFSVGQEKEDSLANALSSLVLSQATEVAVGGDVGTPSEVIAFNMIYRSPLAGQKFKDIYLRSSIAGKFYCLIGLYLIKDTEYEKYKTEFLSLKTDKGISFRAGCMRFKYDKGELLNKWIEGFSSKVWYTEALIIK